MYEFRQDIQHSIGLTLIASQVGARRRGVEAMQHQGALRQAGTFVAQHCAGNCTAPRQIHNTEIRHSTAEAGASMQCHAILPQHWWSVKECGVRTLSHALLLNTAGREQLTCSVQPDFAGWHTLVPALVGHHQRAHQALRPRQRHRAGEPGHHNHPPATQELWYFKWVPLQAWTCMTSNSLHCISPSSGSKQQLLSSLLSAYHS